MADTDTESLYKNNNENWIWSWFSFNIPFCASLYKDVLSMAKFCTFSVMRRDYDFYLASNEYQHILTANRLKGLWHRMNIFEPIKLNQYFL
jgi:hypothetical protein